MIDPTEREKQAMAAGGKLAGEYLDHLKKTDMAELSDDEYATFVECIVSGYVDELQKLPTNPFELV